MDLKKYKITSKILGALLILSLQTYLPVRAALIYIEPPQRSRPSLTGKKSCRECHLEEYKDWEVSHDDRAIDVANDSTVLGDFSGLNLKAGEVQQVVKQLENTRANHSQ